MIFLKQSECRATLNFWHRQIDLPPQYLQRQYPGMPFKMMWFLVSSFTWLATFDGNAFAGLFLPKDARIVMKNSLWNSNIPIFCFCTVRKRFHAFAIEAFTTHAKKGRHHFFELMWTVNNVWTQTGWTDQLHPFACCRPQKVLALVHHLVPWLTLTTVELCWQDCR